MPYFALATVSQPMHMSLDSKCCPTFQWFMKRILLIVSIVDNLPLNRWLRNLPPRREVNVSAVLIAGEKGTLVVQTKISIFDYAASWMMAWCFVPAEHSLQESLDSNVDWLLESGLGCIWICFCLCLHFFCFVLCQLFICEAACLTQHLGACQSDRVSAGLVSHYCQEKNLSQEIY